MEYCNVTRGLISLQFNYLLRQDCLISHKCQFKLQDHTQIANDIWVTRRLLKTKQTKQTPLPTSQNVYTVEQRNNFINCILKG